MTKPRFVVTGHAMKKTNPLHPYRWECSCGAWASVYVGGLAANWTEARRRGHDEHKIAVLRSQGKLREE